MEEMEANVRSRSGQVGLKVSSVFFGVFGVVTALLSLAPGAPGPLWVLLRTVAVVLIVAAVGVGADKAWASIPAIAAGALGVLAALVMMALVPVFIFPEALAGFALVLLVGSSFTLYTVIRDHRRQAGQIELIDQLILLGSRDFMIATVIVTVYLRGHSINGRRCLVSRWVRRPALGRIVPLERSGKLEPMHGLSRRRNSAESVWLTPWARYGSVTAFLLGCTIPLSSIVNRRYGPAAARRFSAGMGTALLGQQALVAMALKRGVVQTHASSRHRLNLVDTITLSRGGTGALMTGLIVSGVRHRRGIAGWLGWIALVYGAIVSDWLDGPIARRLGTSEVGAMFDIEADSWLTLSSSAAAMTWGGLPAYVVAPPILRYLRLAALRPFVPYRQLVSGDPLWTRHIGMAQMTLFIAALAPFRGRATRLLVRIGTPPIVISQLASLAYVSWRKIMTVSRPM
jgi:phosphatidylglycerophosphate synthase